MPSRVENKNQYVHLWQRGVFGNHPAAWDHLEDVPQSYRGTLTLRYKGASGGGFCTYKVPQPEVPNEIARWIERGADPHLIYFGEDPPDQKLILQGEAMDGPWSPHLMFSTVRAPMRIALAEERQFAEGLQARSLLQRTMSPSSYEDFWALWEAFPDAVIEFGVYTCEVGNLRGRNTIIWEVRHY